VESVFPKRPQDPQGLSVDGLHGTQQGCFFVQGLSAVGAKGRGDTEGLVFHKSERGGIPGSVASGLKGAAQSAGRKGGGIRFALDQGLAGKFHNHLAGNGRGNKSVVFFGGDAGHGLKPMGIMGGAFLQRPILHGIGHHIGHIFA